MTTVPSMVLDTSVVVRHFREAGAISNRLAACEELCLPHVALGELYAGAYRSARTQKNLAQIEQFLSAVTVMLPDEQTAVHYGRISGQLAKQGRLIPQNDIWIAAFAIQWNLPLATCDGHFSNVEGLTVEMW